MSLSAVDSFEKFSRLGFKVNSSYSLNKLLEIITSQEFKDQHSCHPSGQTIVDQLNQELHENIEFFVGVVGTGDTGLIQYHSTPASPV